MNGPFRRALPSLITFASLTCAFAAVVLAIHDLFTLSGACILIGNALDAIDGALARRLGVTSAFGLQLDSLVDMVTFGVAPSVLVYQYLRHTGTPPLLVWGACAAYLIGGAFRLARFNLLPAKTPRSDSVGLTISTAGATLALGVLADRAYGAGLIPPAALLALAVALALLMVSRIRYPALATVFRSRVFSVAVLSVAAVLAIRLPPQLVGLGLTSGYVSFGLLRAFYESVA